MLIPFFLIFTVFTVWPVIMSVILSFTNYNVFETPKFVGWDNYVNLLVNDDVFVTAFRNTIVFAIFTGPVSFCKKIRSTIFRFYVDFLVVHWSMGFIVGSLTGGDL